MYIKIYTRSQLILLRNPNQLLDKYKIPQELLDEIGHVLISKCIGQNGFIALLLYATTGKLSEIVDTLNYYPQQLNIQIDIEGIEVSHNNTWLTKKRQWYKDFFQIKGSSDKVCVLYSVKLKPYYDL